MSYSTPEMVRKALVPSSDGTAPTAPTHTAADLSDAQLQDAITEADAMIDGYIGGVYTTPVSPSGSPPAIPAPVNYLSRNIAAYIATLTYRGSQDFGDNDPIARRYRDAETLLKGVGTGRVSLPLPRNTGTGAVASVGQAVNPYVGDLWTPDDFSIGPDTPGRGWSPYWVSP